MNRRIKAIPLKGALLMISLLVVAFFWMNEKSESTITNLAKESKTSVSPVLELKPNLENSNLKTEVKDSNFMPVYYKWRNFTTQDGLLSDKANCVRVDGERVWIGTKAGLVCYENGRFRTYTVEDGLAHPFVLSIDVSPLTGDVWIGTMGGLNRVSAGRMDMFDQFNSGLANNVVYSVACHGFYVWTATASGACRFNTYTQQWSIFNQRNAPMHEPWTYGVSADQEMVYIAAWGGGVLEFNTRTEQWKDYVDPDKEMELDIFPDDGLVHDITASLSYKNGILWVATYFGLSRYDGARWRGYFDHDSGLVSNFINFVKANGSVVWICTDKGLNSFDGTTWVTYRQDISTRKGEILISKGKDIEERRTSSTALAHNFILGVDFQDDRLWVATSKGISLGVAYWESDRLTP